MQLTVNQKVFPKERSLIQFTCFKVLYNTQPINDAYSILKDFQK
ncbi:hypothetical protein [Nostoc edaphicum]|nr:hypothetical protein [Nostoc edaphicum]